MLGRLCRDEAPGDVIPVLERRAPSWLLQLPEIVDTASMERLRRRWPPAPVVGDSSAMDIWTSMFQPQLPYLEKILRPIVVYAFLVVGLRLAGKRELAQLNPFDLVVLLMLSNTVQNAIIGNDNSTTGGLVGATALLAVNAVVVRFLYRHQGVEQAMVGDPDVLIEDGEVRPDHLRRERIRPAELESAARRQGFASLADVERAVLEPGGVLSFVGRTSAHRDQEVLARLDDLGRQLARLTAAPGRASS